MPTPPLSCRQCLALLVALTGVCLGIPSALPARAATPEAWAAHEKEVTAACVAASALQEARAAGQPVEFDDATGMTALLLIGRHAPGHLQGQRARELCLFDKRSRKAAVAPADALFTPLSRP